MKSGFVTLAGRSNVGKSTLLNALVGTKAAITSPLPQTTRTPIRGILNDSRGQAVLVDAPGIFESSRGPLTRKINEAARQALKGVDLILYIMDPTRDVGVEEYRIATLVRNAGIPVIMVMNKADLPLRDRKWHTQHLELIPNPIAVHNVSALQNQHLKPLIDDIFANLPVGERFYPAEQRADVPKEFWIAEIIREKIYLVMTDEIPYMTTVRIDDISERENGTLVISARILTSHNRYKKMIIGAGAKRIKQIGQMARKDLELALHKKIFLDLHVTVDEKWQKR